MTHTFKFNDTQFNNLFPFYILVNRELKVVSFGKSFGKLFKSHQPKKFNDFFSIPRPNTPIHSLEDLIGLQNQLVLLETATENRISLKGQLEYLDASDEVLFIGSPWFNSMEQVTENGLIIDDFARHDPLIDLLHVLKSQENSNEDLKQLITTINKQANDLKKANQEIHDIALFTTQNPDPLIRINFAGTVLRTNNAAEALLFFEYEYNTYSFEDFFSLIATKINKNHTTCIIEATANHNDYSFVCVTMRNEAYINIYGRDITQQNKDQKQLQRLSLVASANENGVLFTTPDGFITWANKGFCTLTNYSLNEVLGKSPIELCKGPLSNKTVVNKMLKAFYYGQGNSNEVIFYRKNDTWFWGRVVSQPIKNNKGEITEYFGIIQDVTEEMASNEKLQVLSQIVEDNINAVVIADKDGKITWVNKSFTDITGYTLEESLGKKPGQILQGPETNKETVAYLRKQILNGEPFTTEIINYRKSGEKYWLRLQGQPIKNKKGELTAFFAIEEDITKERESEQRFRQALENIGDYVWDQNLTTGKMHFSKSKNGFLGYAVNEMTNTQDQWWAFVHEDDLHLLIENDWKYKAKQINAHSLEYRILHKDGTIKWILDRGVVIEKDRNGKPLRITGTHTDITDRKNTETLLEKQRKFYEDILNNMPADIAVFNQNHEYQFVNPRGIKDDELRTWIIGKRDEDYCRLKNKPFSIAKGRRDTFNQVMATKMPSEWEEKYINPAGEEQFMLRRWFPVLDAEEKVKLIIGYGMDITERRKFEDALKVNEEKYRSIIANMNLGLMEMDAQQKISFANQTLLNMIGLSAEESVGYDAKSFLPLDSIAEVHDRIKNQTIRITEAFEVKINIKNKPGWWLVSAAPKLAITGNFIGYIVICLDISNQKKLEQELIKSREQAEQLAKAKEIFLANMSHEIRTPMNAIMGMGNQLAKTNLSQQQNFYLNTINTAADNLLVIINDILDLSKIQSGKLSVEQIGFMPKNVVGNAMHVLLYKAQEKGIKLTNSFCDDRLHPILIGDPYRLNQVLLNLLSNAIKFTEKGFVDITCEVINDTPTTQTIQAKVIDTGVGMEEKFTNKLFDKFSQEYESVSRKYGGTGLGMSICKELIELMGGEINVSSKKGFGTTIRFTIEFKKGTQADIEETHVDNIEPDFLKGKNILVTDDNEMNRLVASTILENYGATVIEAANGEEALHEFDNNAIDLVLMDIQMPIMNGYDAVQLIRKKGSTVPIIALTANAISGENKKCIDAGMNDYISKPFKEDEFLKRIAHWVNTEMPKEITLPVESVVSETPLYDLSLLNEISRGNQAFMNKMILLFCEQSPIMVTQIKEAFLLADFATMNAIAHKLKPSIDNLKIKSLKQVVRFIEKTKEEDAQAKTLAEPLHILETTINAVVYTLQQQFPK